LEKQKIHQGVGGVCEEKQNITKEWERFVSKSRRLPRIGGSLCGKAEDLKEWEEFV
jgi:hypothetical protein